MPSKSKVRCVCSLEQGYTLACSNLGIACAILICPQYYLITTAGIKCDQRVVTLVCTVVEVHTLDLCSLIPRLPPVHAVMAHAGGGAWERGYFTCMLLLDQHTKKGVGLQHNSPCVNKLRRSVSVHL